MGEKQSLNNTNYVETQTKSQIQIEDALCFNLYTASRLMTQVYAEYLDQLNLTYLQFLVMNLLWTKDKVTLKSLGDRLYLDSGTLTPLINRLSETGYLKKEKSKKDEREVFIGLTAKGRNLQKKSSHIPKDMFCKLDVTFERFEEIRNGVQEILKNLNHQKLKQKQKKQTTH